MSLYELTIALKAFLIVSGGADQHAIMAEFPEAGNEAITRALLLVLTSVKRGKTEHLSLIYFADPVKPGAKPLVSVQWAK
jgi:hypothetical protein